MRATWFVRELERRERAWAAERAQLVATICHLADRPITPTELDEFTAEKQRERDAALQAAREAEDDLVDYDQLPD